jgi:hypothetical protein
LFGKVIWSSSEERVMGSYDMSFREQYAFKESDVLS